MVRIEKFCTDQGYGEDFPVSLSIPTFVHCAAGADLRQLGLW